MNPVYALIVVWSVGVLTLLGLEAGYQVCKYLGLGRNVRTRLGIK